ncbi:MAG: hypothetical protein P2A85_28920 (plasmid) [Microcoleus anatoxicus]|uniref:hypothetical protein n=1 Tax=Microcoleus anatoxicus TaxID=2705319 RepID=UPI003671F5B9
MSAKKRKPLDSVLEEFVFGTKEAALLPPTPEVVSPAPTASQTPETVEAALPAPTAPEFESPASESIPAQSKESSLTHRLQAPDKEATVRFTVDMSESLHRKLSMLAARTGRKKVDIVRMLLEDGLKEVES